MMRTYRFLLRPTSKQARLMEEMLDDLRFLYNAALQERRDAYRHPSKTRIRYGDQSVQLKDIRAGDPDYSRWSFTAEQKVLIRLNRAFEAFFRRVKSGRKPGFPRFKGKDRFNAVVHSNRDGARWDSVEHPTQTRVYFQGVGHVKVRQHRPVPGQVKLVTLRRQGRRWFVLVSSDIGAPQPLPRTGKVVGLDMATGANGLAYTSDDERLDNPRYGHAAADRLVDAQKQLARCKMGSRRRAKARERVRRIHGKIRGQRAHHLHQMANALTARYDVIVAEKLPVAQMTRRVGARPDPSGVHHLPNGQAAKSGLNRSILDAGWGIFLEMLSVKAECAGREFIQVNPAFTSQTCSACGHRDEGSRSGKHFRCRSCGYTKDADVNAAVNILRAGLVLRTAVSTAPREAR